MENKRFVIILTVIAVAFMGIIFWTGNKDDKKNASDTSSNGASSENYYGKLDSPVTITEFVDFQCEACYGYYPYVKQVKELYKDKVRFQVRNFPIDNSHQFARQAARSAQAAANQNKFWEMHDMLFEGQKQWERTQDPQSYFDQYAKQIGLDMVKFEQDRKSSATNSIINADLAAVKAIGGDSTPTFAINGKKAKERPAPSVESLSEMIDKALKDAENDKQ
jgi:protein-disulfide isomerase